MFAQITDHIYVMEHQPEVDRPYIGYIRGTHKSLLVDAGNSSQHMKLIMKQLELISQPAPDIVVLTHAHWDHSFGLSSWTRAPVCASSYAGERTNRILAKMHTWDWTMEAFEAKIKTNEIPLFCREHILLEYPGLSEIVVTSAQYSITERMSFDLGGISCIAIPVISPHTDDGVVYYCPEENVLFIGDAYCEEVIGTDWIDRPRERKAFTETLMSLDFVYCVTGHHGIMTREAFFDAFGYKE